MISLEILGKKTNVNVIRASYLLAQATNITSQITKKLGFGVAYLVHRLWNLLHKLFDPVFSSLKEAFCDIFGAAGVFLYKNISEFLSGYNIGSENTYNKLATNVVSIVFCLGGAALLLLGLEAYGTVKKNQSHASILSHHQYICQKNITATRFVAALLAGGTVYVAAKRFGINYFI